MTQTVFVLNGPNLNMLGKREPGIYGGKTLKDIETDCKRPARELGFEIDFRQSNHEGVLVDWIHEAGDKAVGVAINAGAYTIPRSRFTMRSGHFRSRGRAPYLQHPCAGRIPPQVDDRAGGRA
jgi:hypothetical protein